MSIAEPLHQLFPHVPFKGTYGVREAARVLAISRRKLYQAIDTGEIVAWKPGYNNRKGLNQSTRIPGDQLRAYIERYIFDPHA